MPRTIIDNLKEWLTNQQIHHDHQKTHDLKRNTVFHSTFSVAYSNVLNEIEKLEKLENKRPEFVVGRRTHKVNDKEIIPNAN